VGPWYLIYCITVLHSRFALIILTEECWDETAEAVVTIHLTSRPLSRLPIYSRWGKPLKAAWDTAQLKHAPRLEDSLDDWELDGDGLALVNGVLELRPLRAESSFPRAT
jgi:hypothetical protein